MKKCPVNRLDNNKKRQGRIWDFEKGARGLRFCDFVRRPPLDIWGEAWSFCRAIFIFSTREIVKALIFFTSG